MQQSQPYIQYDNQEQITSMIRENLEQILTINPAARITIDSSYGINERLLLDLGLEVEADPLFHNLSVLLFKQLMSYYISSDEQSSHFGISNFMLEGHLNSAFRKETESILNKIQERADLAGFVLQKSHFIQTKTTRESEMQGLGWFLKEHLDLHLGYKITFKRNRYESQIVFLPLAKASQAQDQLAINLEKILLLHYSHLDEVSSEGLKLTETMILKDVERILNRAKGKQGTREKLLENIDPSVLQPGSRLNQPVYCYLNIHQQTSVSESNDNLLESNGDMSIAAYTIDLKEILNVEKPASFKIPLKTASSTPLSALAGDLLDQTPAAIETQLYQQPETSNSHPPTLNKASVEELESTFVTPEVTPVEISTAEFSAKHTPIDHVGSNKDQSVIENSSSETIDALQETSRKPQNNHNSITLEAAIKNVEERSFILHPLEKQFLLYPYKSDFEKAIAKAKADSNERESHPKVENFINRRFARRTNVSHPLQPSREDTPRRRHYDKKD